MDLTAQRGAIPVELDHTRTLFFDMAATGLLIDRFGQGFALALYKPVMGGKGIELKSTDALAYFLWAGLQAEIRGGAEPLTEKAVGEFIRPWTVNPLFTATYRALVGAVYTPEPAGKAEADGAAAGPDVDEAAKVPGPTKVSTSSRRSGLRSGSSAGRRSGSGR